MSTKYTSSSACISDCGHFRYSLTRVWDEAKPMIAFIGLNPSTADESEDDNTIRKCVKFARRDGFGSLCMINLFAFRATQPADMKRHGMPIGRDNDRTILETVNLCNRVVACWGNPGSWMSRDKAVCKMLEKHGVALYCLEVTKSGQPKHPLYIKDSQAFMPYNGEKK